MKTADLSVDFDFFSRELLEWDWGHSETDDGQRKLFEQVVWQIRYGQIDLHEETGFHHTDFNPVALFVKLEEKGVVLRNGVHRRRGAIRQAAMADSHKHAFDFFRRQKAAPDMLLNIDAHHDCFGLGRPELDKASLGAGLHCGNWLTRVSMLPGWEATRIAQLYPKWKDPAEDGEPVDSGRPIEVTTWREFDARPEEYVVRNVFLCRSPVWLPPHHDKAFTALAQQLSYHAANRNRIVGTKMLMRDAPTPEQSAAWREENERQFAELKASIETQRQQEVAE